MKTGIIT